MSQPDPDPVTASVEETLKTLQRYAVSGDRPGTMVSWPAGEFVFLEQIRALLLASETQQQALRAALEGLIQELEQGKFAYNADWTSTTFDTQIARRLRAALASSLPSPPETP